MTISRLTVAAIGLFLAASLTSLTAVSQERRLPCGERTAIMSHLKDGYSESVTAMGLDAQGRMLEVLANQMRAMIY